MVVLVGSRRDLPAETEIVRPEIFVGVGRAVLEVATVVREIPVGRAGVAARYGERTEIGRGIRGIAVAEISRSRMVELRGDILTRRSNPCDMVVVIVGVIPIAIRMVGADQRQRVVQVPVPTG